MRLRCPCCHAEASLEAWAEDDAARELMALLAGLDADVGRPLVAYLGLFRPRKSALSWERALRLAREALALCTDSARLAAALSQTVESLRAKRADGDLRPLGNHNYLRRVLEGVPQATSLPCVADTAARVARPSATVDAVMRLEAIKRAARDEDGR